MFSAAAFHVSKHLAEQDLEPEHGACDFCGSTDFQVVTRLQSDPVVDLLACRRCKVCTASRLPTAAALADYYGGYYDSSATSEPEESHVTFNNVRRFARHLRGIVQHDLPSGPLQMLDFGGGDGAIALALGKELRTLGHDRVDITVVDYHDQVVRSDDEAVSLRHEPDLDALPEEQFDLILASAVLEHLPDSRAKTERLIALLRPRGLLYIRTPFMVPLIKLAKRLGVSIDFTFPGHIHDMGQEFWEGYFSQQSPSRPHRILHSRPSIVETVLAEHFLRTCIAHVLKLPWKLLGRRYGLVGGWEIVLQKAESNPA